MSRFLIPYEQVLRAWPQLRGHFRDRARFTEAELQAFFDQALPAVTAEVWPSVRQGLVRSQLLHQVAPGLLAFGGPVAQTLFKPVLEPGWVELWQHLQASLSLPMGCLWSTQWLHAILPQLPARLVVEVNWAELQWASRLVKATPRFCLAEAGIEPLAAGGREIVVLRSFQRASPVRRIQGVPTARLEKLLVDVSTLPELTAATSDQVLLAALSSLRGQYELSSELLLQYAARNNAAPRWEALLTTAAA
ncbi:hypothetical protein LJY25_12370 [Hymenobacter sp. BT175]|uniref:DUF6577 family protein n=1 Tax=Hymenobacter translucens TaxID=2886507 RepID=UPI001D0E067B|nr:DUF6577 family protein [Hymenobacter translucens]MCC2547244.1 hypothetical protein [Hymenobacter translucens]